MDTVKKIWQTLEVVFPILEGVDATVDKEGTIVVKGKKGENTRLLRFPNVAIEIKDKNFVISTKRLSKNEKKIMHTYRAHINNMMKGVNEGFEYNLKVVYAKFPMTVEVKGKTVVIKNFLGEKVPRVRPIYDDVTVKINSADITVTGIDKEKCGQQAALIEQMTRITHLDRRVIQDGVFITKKPHVEYS